MNKFLGILALLAFVAAPAMAQEEATPDTMSPGMTDDATSPTGDEDIASPDTTKDTSPSMISSSSSYSSDRKTTLGLDFALPYTLKVDGNSVKERANFNMGVDGRYYVNENWNIGSRLNYDVEKQTGSYRQIVFAPGVQYHFMPNETWSPYLRMDLPVILKGAACATSSSKQDIGFSGGLGLGYNLGNAIGVENMSLRYDFNFGYTFGMGKTVPVLAVEFFKIGFDYRF